jgi:hypothetical protein
MKQCKQCGSFAINENSHGREPGKDLHLCDVCYWRKRAEMPSNTRMQPDACLDTECNMNEDGRCIEIQVAIPDCLRR